MVFNRIPDDRAEAAKDPPKVAEEGGLNASNFAFNH
jgi:hypothetical protein